MTRVEFSDSQSLKVIFHLELLYNIDHISHVEQDMLVANFILIVGPS